MDQPEDEKILRQYRAELIEELNSIVGFWIAHTVDNTQGGFYGAVNNDNIPDALAPKGVVLNSRILWMFSAATRFNHPECKPFADRAFQFINDHFIDAKHGGVFWTVDHAGKQLDDKKQIYGLAFCIYGMAEYFRESKNEKALQIAKDLYELIEKHSYDDSNGGYLEAFTRSWGTLSNLRLSEKDENERKTMNTHLHVLEAYTNLYRIWPNAKLYSSILFLLNSFNSHIINRETGHLHLFFDEDWNVKGDLVSFGHDIEAAWLLVEAAEVIRDVPLLQLLKLNALKMADAVAKALDSDGGLWYEGVDGKLVMQKHSWPQAEAMIGFFAAWQISRDPKYLDLSLRSWLFVKRYILDRTNGEWFWGINQEGQPMPGMDKVGIWKCPYHNSRACMEIVRRIDAIFDSP